MTTLKDVARRVGLSVTTVSRALNDFDDVAVSTRELVRAAAEELDYHPNVLARGLQGQLTNTVGLDIPLVLRRSYDAFWLEFIGGVASTCARRKVDLLLATADTHDGAGAGLKSLFRSKRIDGLLVCDIRKNDSRLTFLQRRHFPFVAFGRTGENINYPFVDVDGAAGVMQIIDHLVGLGHRRIAYLGLDPEFGFSHYRFAGYCDALRLHGLPFDESLVHLNLEETTVTEMVTTLCQQPQRPTALFAEADVMALEALRAVRACGLSVPDDISLVTFDDSFVVEHAAVPLTALSQPNRRLGEEAAAILHDRVMAPEGAVVQRLIVPSLVRRASTASPPPCRD